LTGLIVEGRQPLRDGGDVLIDSENVGTLSSGNYSPILQCGIGMGLLRDAPDVNTPATVVLRGREISATITPLPFVRKAK
jgi:aminomethyltransferase